MSDNEGGGVVSDSEEEEQLVLSQARIIEALRRRGTRYVKRTGLVSGEIFDTIEQELSRNSSNVIFDDLFDDETDSVGSSGLNRLLHTVNANQQQQPEIHELEPDSHDREAVYNNRGKRVRQRSFFQQHIYTIDAVSYTLRMDRDEATEYVKKHQELIDKHKEGNLRSYLRKLIGSNEKSSTKSVSKQPTQSKRKRAVIRDDDSQESQMIFSQDTFDPIAMDQQDLSDEEYIAGSDLSGSESGKDPVDGSDNEATDDSAGFTFRGRYYRNIEELSKGSRLPKSFFSMQLKRTPQTSVSIAKKRKVQEDRVGVARKKKKQHLPDSNNHPLEPIQEMSTVFTTGEDSQERGGDDFHRDFPQDDMAHALEDGPMFSDAQGTQEFYRVYEHQQDTSHNYLYDGFDDSAEAMEDYSSDFAMMLAPRERKTLKSPRTPSSGLKSTKGSSSRLKKRFQRKHAATSTSSTTRSAKATPYKRTKPRQRQSTLQGLPGVLNIDDSLGLPKSAHSPSRSKADTSSPRARVPRKRVPQKKSFFIEPGSNYVVPRHAYTSTLVAESLSTEYAIIHKKVAANPHAINEDDVNVYDIDAPAVFINGFQSSNAYKCLFTDERVDVDHEYRVELGQRTIVLSRLMHNTSEKVKEFFDFLSDQSSLRSVPKDLLMESFYKVIEFCSGINVAEARQLVSIVDNFKVRLEDFIRRKGQLKDIDFFMLSLCYLLYFCSFKIFDANSMSAFDFILRAREVLTLFFEFLGYLDGPSLKKKLRQSGMLSESLSMLFLTHQDLTWSVIENAEMNDMESFMVICGRYRSGGPKWKVVRKVLSKHFNGRNFEMLRIDFGVIFDLVYGMDWKIDDSTLLSMYDILRDNKFGNIPGERSQYSILSESGEVNGDTMMNKYLSLLIRYGDTGGQFPGRFIEKIIPVSKAPSDIDALCNRLNILLALLRASHKPVDHMFSSLVLSCEFHSKIVVRAVLKASSTLINLNTSQNRETKVSFLSHIVERNVQKELFSEIWSNFLHQVNFSNLPPGTQKNLLKVIAPFSSYKSFFKVNEKIVYEFAAGANDRKDLVFLRTTFEDLNPSLFPDLWCSLFGKIVKNGMDNWSRLIHQNNFQDAPRFYAFMLQTSGTAVYLLHKDRFILSLLEYLVGGKMSGSLNSFIRELSKVDPKLLSCKNVVVQTHRIQVTINLIYNLLKCNSDNVRSRFLAVIVSFVKRECDEASRKNNQQYLQFARKVIEFINIYGFEYVRTSKVFEQLCIRFELTKRESEEDSRQLMNMRGNEGLQMLEEKLIDSFKSSFEFSKKISDAILAQRVKPFGPSEAVSESKVFMLGCLLSVHIELLPAFPSCWILLSELTKTLVRVLERDYNLNRVDMLCLMKVVRLLPFALTHRKTRFEGYEIMSLRNIYRILILMFYRLGGLNEMECFKQLTMPFTSSEAIYEAIFPDGLPQYLTKTPGFIKDMIVTANLTGHNRAPNTEKLKNEVDELFNLFVTSIESTKMTDEEIGIEE